MDVLFNVFFIVLLLFFLHIFRIPRWTPVYVFCILWSAQFLIGYILFPGIEWSFVTALYFFACGFAGILGYVAYSHKKHNVRYFNGKGENLYRYNLSAARRLLLIYIFFGTMLALISLGRYGFTLRAFTTIDSLLAMNNEIAILRYSGRDIIGGTISKIASVITYAAPLAGGYHYVFSEKKLDYILCFLSFLPEFVFLFSTNGKAGFIACIILWMSGYFVAVFHIRRKVYISLKTMAVAAVAMMGIVLILLSTMVLRTGVINDAIISVVLNKFKSYAFGHVVALNNWLDVNVMKGGLTLGYQTFIGIARYLVGGVRVQGVYADFYREHGFYTNVYSYFRGLYMDFGFIGSCLFFLLFGYFSAYAIQRIWKKKNGVYISEMLLMAEYFFCLYFAISIFSYGNFTLLLPTFAFHLFLCQRNVNICFVKKRMRKPAYVE